MPNWQITNDTLGLLDQMKGQDAGSVRLTATGIDSATADRVVGAVRRYGKKLSALRFEPKWRLERWDFGDFDFAAKCPALDELTLGRCLVHRSVFAHPAITELTLRESKVVGPKELAVDSAALGFVTITDSFTASKVVFGPVSAIRSIDWSIDEDCSDATPDRFVCDGCPNLRRIDIRACGAWALELRGTLPALTSTAFDASRYCRYEIVTAGLSADSSEHSRALKPGTFGRDEADGM